MTLTPIDYEALRLSRAKWKRMYRGAERAGDEARAEVERLRAALTNIAARCADGVVTLAAIEQVANAALATTEERR